MGFIKPEPCNNTEIPYKNDCLELILETHEEIAILERLLREAKTRLVKFNREHKVTIPNMDRTYLNCNKYTWKNYIVNQLIYLINTGAYYLGSKQRF